MGVDTHQVDRIFQYGLVRYGHHVVVVGPSIGLSNHMSSFGHEHTHLYTAQGEVRCGGFGSKPFGPKLC